MVSCPASICLDHPHKHICNKQPISSQFFLHSIVTLHDSSFTCPRNLFKQSNFVHPITTFSIPTGCASPALLSLLRHLPPRHLRLLGRATATGSRRARTSTMASRMAAGARASRLHHQQTASYPLQKSQATKPHQCLQQSQTTAPLQRQVTGHVLSPRALGA